MAYDPEARRQSNSAKTIAIVSALLLGGGLLAYLATRRDPEPGPTTVLTTPARDRTVVVNNTVSVPVPVVMPTSAPNVVVREVPQTVVVQPAPGTNTVTRVERNSTTVRDRVIAPAPAAGSGSAAPAPNTNVTINNAPPPGTSTQSGATSGSTATDGAAPGAAPDGAANAAPSGGY